MFRGGDRSKYQNPPLAARSLSVPLGFVVRGGGVHATANAHSDEKSSGMNQARDEASETMFSHVSLEEAPFIVCLTPKVAFFTICRSLQAWAI